MLGRPTITLMATHYLLGNFFVVFSNIFGSTTETMQKKKIYDKCHLYFYVLFFRFVANFGFCFGILTATKTKHAFLC